MSSSGNKNWASCARVLYPQEDSNVETPVSFFFFFHAPTRNLSIPIPLIKLQPQSATNG